MVRRPVKIAIEDISYCGGCDVAIVDVGEDLLKLLEIGDIQLVYAPMLLSSRDYKDDVDIVLVIGAVRNEHDLERIKRAREKAKILVAFGSCACFGGLPSLANMYDKADLLRNAYEKSPTIDKGGPPHPSKVPSLLNQVLPLSEYVNVDYYVPGCPPPPPIIKSVIANLLKRVGR